MILIYIEQTNGEIKKRSIETISYGVQLAKILQTSVAGIVIGKLDKDIQMVSNYGLEKIYVVDVDISYIDAFQYSKILQIYIEKLGVTTFVITNNIVSKSISARVSHSMDAGLITNVIGLPSFENNKEVYKKVVFSGKAYQYVEVLSLKKVITLSANSFIPITESVTTEVIQETIQLEKPITELMETHKTTGDISLTDAEIVVSGGRGLKGPENWNIVLDLAKELNAATACSRPVADSNWRPHYEHVGQTGLQISPNLYIAIGISGAIQHLAGVNRSKYIVVINKDIEAPFVKNADYAIIGDAFDIVPKLTKAIQDFKKE